MSDISKDELKKEIAAILKDADLSAVTSKKVRQDIEEKLDIDLTSRRKEVDELVMEYINKGKSKKNGSVDDEDDEELEDNEDDDEDEEEEDKKPKRSNTNKKSVPAKRYKSASSDESDEASEGEGDDEYSPKKKAAKKPGKRGAAGKKKKGGSDDDSDEDWGKGKKKGGGAKKGGGGAKRGGGGYTKPIRLSPELSALLGEEEMPRHEVVKRMWAIIKERNLYDPKNKQFAICDDDLLKVFGVKRFRTFGMMKFLKNHFVSD